MCECSPMHLLKPKLPCARLNGFEMCVWALCRVSLCAPVLGSAAALGGPGLVGCGTDMLPGARD